ncbi:MAG: nitrite/sulfite reductase, partial [Planctomycetota bacterium]
HFQVMLGGEWEHNARTYGLAMGAVPSKSVPDVIGALTDAYLDERETDEAFLTWVNRRGKKSLRDLLKPFMALPDYDLNRDAFTDWGDPREFTIGDMGVGECAGEMVSLFEMEIAKAESEAFDAQLALEDEDFDLADKLGYSAMLIAARGLIIGENPDITREPNHIVDDFRTRFFDTELFFHPQMKGIFAGYLFQRHENPPSEPNQDLARKTVEESQLFIEACHACDLRMSQAKAASV